MYDAGAVRLGQCGGYLRHDLHSSRQLDGAPVERGPQSDAIDIFAGDEVIAFDLSNVVDCQYIGVVQRRRRSRLLLKALQHLFFRGKLGGKKLERYLSAQTRVDGQVHVAHSPRTQMLLDPIRSELTVLSHSGPDHRIFARKRAPTRLTAFTQTPETPRNLFAQSRHPENGPTFNLRSCPRLSRNLRRNTTLQRYRRLVYRALLLHVQAVVNGVESQLEPVGNAQLVEDVVQMILHGLFRDEHLLSNLLVLVALG